MSEELPSFPTMSGIQDSLYHVPTLCPDTKIIFSKNLNLEVNLFL